MGNLIFRDSRTTRTKTLVMPTPVDDIVLTLPGESGILATTNTLGQKLINKESAGFISNILKPDITENNGGILNPEDHNQPLLRASYKTSPSYQGTLDTTEWVASLDFAFTQIVDTTKLLEYKDAWLPNVATPGTKVFVRYRFHSGKLRSPWSDTLIYKTPVYGLEPFNIVVTAGTMSPALIVSKFKAYGENLIGPINHTATTWKVYEGDKVVYESLANTVDKLKHVVPYGYLKVDTEYKAEVVFHTDNRTFPVSKASYKMFTTPNIYIVTPYVKYKYNGGNHSLEGSAFSIVGTPELHYSTYWELYRIENGKKILVYKKERDTVNLTSLLITNMLFGRGLTYEVTIGYNTPNISSKHFTTTFKPIDDLADPIQLTIEEDTDKLPILKISKFHVVGHTDNIKNFALRIRNLGTNIDTEEKLLTIPNTYNTDITRKLTPAEYISWFNGRTDILRVMPYFEISGYYVGEKFNSPVGKTNMIPTIECNCNFTVDARDHTYVKVTSTVNTGTATWLNITKKTYVLSGGHLNNEIRIEESSDHSVTLGVAQGLQYGRTYNLSLMAETDIGTILSNPSTFSLYQGAIKKPNLQAKWDIEGVTQPRLYVTGDGYVYDKPEIPGSGYKETEIRVLKGSEVIAETKDSRNAGTWVALPKSRFSNLDWNTNYKIEMKYVADNGVKSPAGELEYSLPVKPTVAVTIPTISASLSGKTIVATTSAFNITGVEDKSHYSTTWELYDDKNVIIYSSLKDTVNLTSITFPAILIEYGKTYLIKAKHIGVDDIASDYGSKNIATINFSNYTYSYSVWSWPRDDGQKSVINGIINFFQSLKNDHIADYQVVEYQAHFLDEWFKRRDREHVSEILRQAQVRGGGTEGYGTVIKYKALAGGLRVHWQGIPIADGSYIVFSINYEASSMCFTRADTNSQYAFPYTLHRARYKTFSLAPYGG